MNSEDSSHFKREDILLATKEFISHVYIVQDEQLLTEVDYTDLRSGD